MKLKNQFTGIVLAFSVAMSSVTAPAVTAKAANAEATSASTLATADANATNVTYSSVRAEATSTANYVLSLFNDSEIGIYDYRQLILMMQTDSKYYSLFNDYMALVKSYTTDEGKILIDGAENATIYAAVIDILTMVGFDPENYYGADYVDALSTYITSFENAEALNTAIGNPYYYSYIIPAVYSYKDEMKDSEKVLSLLKDAAMLNYKSDENGIGIDYWGVSTDNNGKILPALSYFAKDDDTFNKQMHDAITWTNNNHRMADGGYILSSLYGETESNSNSTAMGLCMLSSYDYADDAKAAYSCLLGLKSKETEGCYTYGGYDSPYSSVDALEGLVTYSRYLAGMTPCAYDVADYKHFEITFSANGGKLKNNSASAKYSVNKLTTFKSLSLANPTRKGYTFAGWYTKKTSGTKLTSSSKFSGAATFYARWQKVTVSKPSTVSLMAGKKSAKVFVKKVSGAKSYTIVYADNKRFSKAKKVTVTKSPATLKSLKSGKTYYVKVCANKTDSTNNIVSSSYTSVKKIKAK